MSDAGASCSTRKASISYESYRISKTHSHNRCGWRQHFTHTGATFWPFIADYDTITRFDFAIHNSRHSQLFSIKTTGDSFKFHHGSRNTGLLDDGPFGSDIAGKDSYATLLFYRIPKRADNLLVHILNAFGQLVS